MFKNYRTLFLLIFLSITLSYAQQTLYWVGGSGKWNEPQHWSLKSGGIPANVIPDKNTKVIIDENSSYSDFVIDVYQNISIKDLEITTLRTGYLLLHQYQLTINGNCMATPLFNIQSEKPIIINGNHSKDYTIKIYSEIKNTVQIQNGNFDVSYIHCDKLILNNSTLILSKGQLETNDIITDSFSKIKLEKSILKSENISNNNIQIISENSHIITNIEKFNKNILSENSSYKLYNPEQVQSCTATLTGYSVSCNSACDGKLVVNLNFTGGCGTPPYTLDWSNSSCTPSPTLNTVLGSGSYTINGVCACANAYVVWVYDSGNNLIAISNNAYVNGPSLINFVPTNFTQPLCNGQCNGSIISITSGGTPPPTGYTVVVDGSTTYTNVPQGSAFTYSNLCAGSHTFLVKDANGCTKTVNVNLSQPPPLLPNGNSQNILCNGICSGSMAVSPTGGTPGYTVNWSNGATNTVAITNLCPGPYTATITDANGCTATYSNTITQPTSITIVPSQTNVSCFGLCDATASVSVSGGVAPYTYSWSCSGSTSNSATALCAGNCTATIKDNNNCVRTQSFSITQPGSITIVPSVTAALCNGSCNGKLSFTVNGGTAPFNFTIQTVGVTGVANPTAQVNNLCAGNYTIFLKDANGCTQVRTFTITQPPALAGSVNTSSVTCFGLCNGTASVTPSGGTPGYTFTWSPGSQTINPISSLCAGNYSVIIKDANNCTVSVNYSIVQPSSITPNVSSTSITCNGLCNGVINSSPTGGTPSYNYTLAGSSSTVTSNPPYSGLCAGNYTLYIKDNNNCVVSKTVNIQQPNALTVTAISTSVSCFGGCDGSVSGSAGGGTPSYTYVWSVPPSGTNFTAAVLTNQCAGIYTLSVVDGNNCTASKTVQIIAPPDITVAVTSNSTSCSYNCNGSITTTVSGGNPGYSYNWSNGSTSPNISGLCAGSYTLTVTDSKNCTKSQVVSVTSPPAISLTANVQNVLCFGQCNGSATATAIGGTPGYVYQWNTVPVTTNSIVTGLCPGNYVLTVTDSKGCVASQNISVTQPPQIQANITGMQASCSSTCIGAATVTPNGGTPAYSYSWTPSGGTGSVATNMCIGNYTVKVTDQNGCTATATVYISQAIFLNLTTSGNTLTCNGSCNGSANVSVSGGVSPYTYTWTSSSGAISNSSNVNNLCAGGYSITVTDSQGCQNTDSVRFVNPPPIVITSSNTTHPNCNGACNGQIGVIASGGTGTLTYSWSPSGLSGNGTPTVTGLCAGNYTLDIKDVNNCIKTQTFSINQPPPTAISFTPSNPTNCSVPNGSVTGTISGGVPNYNYTVTPGSIGNTSGNFNAVNLSAGIHTITVIDANGCITNSLLTLSAPGGPTISSVSIQSVTCFGNNNGSATVAATSTNAPISYTWSPSVSSGSVASGLSSGVYAITVGDAGGCTTSTLITISQPAQFSFNPTTTQPICNSNCSGMISLSPSGGTAPYTYTWLPLGSNSSSVNGLCPGTYTSQVTDANNCQYNQTFTIVPPSTLNVTYTQQNVLCNGACNGSITANVTGGTPPYTYSWSPVGSFPGSSLNNIVGLCPNIYTLNVQDNGSCNVVMTVTITEPPLLTSTLVSSGSVNCNGDCNGSATVTAGGGVLPYSYSWSGTPFTTSVVNALCAGTYSSIVTDANGCKAIKNFTISQPAVINVSVTPFNPACYGICSGSITSLVSGGNGGYTYTWIPSGGNSVNAINLCAGNYTLQIKDSKGCVGQQVTSITNPPKILANISYTNPTSCSICNGVASSSPLNAVSPISYTWTSVPPQNSSTATGLCGGTYTLYITDAKGCRDSGFVTLNAPVTLTINPSMSPSDCSVCNGSITLATSGGSAPYTYSWTPAVSTGSMATSLCSGIYTVTVADVNGCGQTFQLPLSNSNGPNNISITYTNPSCYGYCNGSAVASPPITGGTAPYTYSWVTPPVSSPTISNLCAGNYTVKVTDANNCIYFQSITLTNPNNLSDNPNIKYPQCNGICDGSISLSPSGGTFPYTYNWSTGSTNASITSICPGNYSVMITDFNGCQYPFSYTITGGLSITASTFVVNNNCFNDCNGVASIVGIAGGLPPYSYHWSDPLGQSYSSANGLCNGNYTCTITDNNGCYENFSVTITSPSSITVNYTSNNPTCGQCDGSANVLLTGGTPGYTVNWSNGNTGNSASNLCAGLYMLTITDALGCQQNEMIPISNNTSLLSTVTVTNPACFGNCTGSATITASGGILPYSYLWINSGSTNNIETGLCAGTYFVQVKDSAGCINTNSVQIIATSTIQIVPNVYQADCGVNNGTIITNVTGGNAPYTYTWLPGGSSTATLANVSAGTYTLYVSDANGCTTQSVFVLSNKNAPVVQLNTQNAFCSSSCDGSASLTVTAGTAPYTIIWYDGTTINGSFSNLSGLCTGIVTATVTDNAGCSTVVSGSINSPTNILNSIPIISTPRCYGDTTGSITIITSGGTLPYTYTFLPIGTSNNPLNNIGVGTYTVNITDGNGCIKVFTTSINQPMPIVVNANITDASCSAIKDGAITTTVSGGTPGYSYSWMGPGSYTGAVSSVSNAGVGTYTLSVTDNNGCIKDTSFVISSTLIVIAATNSGTAQCGVYTYLLDGSSSTNATSYQWTQLPTNNTVATTATASVNVSVGSNSFVLTVSNSGCTDTAMLVLTGYPLPNVDAGPYTLLPLGSSTVIGGNPTCATATNYVWMPNSYLNNNNVSNPVTSTTITTTYTVIVTDNNGCINWDTVTVYVYPEINIPNGFSPNGDGKNDLWIIDNIQQFPDCQVEVYSRWGELLFISKGYAKPWDGKYNGQDVPVGTYYYVINLNTPLYPKPYTGPLTIFR